MFPRGLARRVSFLALTLPLGLANRRLAKGEDVADLVAGADTELRAAITELRDLARGARRESCAAACCSRTPSSTRS